MLTIKKMDKTIEPILCAEAFFNRSAVDVAYDLIGSQLLINGKTVFIIETEAYTQSDPASKSFKGVTAHNSPMFERPGTVYVYLTYGLHYCMNISCMPKGVGESVLLRSIVEKDTLISGPGRLTKFLGVDQQWNGEYLFKKDPKIKIYNQLHFSRRSFIQTSQRIGLSKGKDLLYRFYITKEDL